MKFFLFFHKKKKLFLGTFFFRYTHTHTHTYAILSTNLFSFHLDKNRLDGVTLNQQSKSAYVFFVVVVSFENPHLFWIRFSPDILLLTVVLLILIRFRLPRLFFIFSFSLHSPLRCNSNPIDPDLCVCWILFFVLLLLLLVCVSMCERSTTVRFFCLNGLTFCSVFLYVLIVNWLFMSGNHERRSQIVASALLYSRDSPHFTSPFFTHFFLLLSFWVLIAHLKPNNCYFAYIHYG